MIDCRLVFLIVLSSTCFAWILAQQHHSAAIAIPHYIKYPNQQQIPTRVLHKPVLTATIPSGFRFSTTENSIPLNFAKGHQQYSYNKPQITGKQENGDVNEEKDEEEEAEKQEPDRLNQLLLNSKFDCTNRKTGYYADEGLDCEVFHYCQENIRHSWICPDGFTFHQVHLICMPPEGDNICKKSSKYFFVNDYLYKQINAEEVQRRPNATIKYSERYFPEFEDGEIENKNNRHYQTYDSDNDDTDEDENKNYLQNGRKQPVNVAFQTSPRPQSILGFSRPHSVQFIRNVNFQPQHGQVFRSPEEVNISLQQRKPALFSQRSINIANADDDNDN